MNNLMFYCKITSGYIRLHQVTSHYAKITSGKFDRSLLIANCNTRSIRAEKEILQSI